MANSRESFLERVRQAVAEGNRAGLPRTLEARGAIAYQGAGADPVERFGVELANAGGVLHVVADRQAATAAVLALVQARPAHKLLLGRGSLIDTLDLHSALTSAGLEVRLAPEADRETLFAADIGISGVEYLVAETGSVVVASRPVEPRSLSLLPPVHIAVAERRQLLPDLFDLFTAFATVNGTTLPSCLSVITGPSKTGDIELKLVTGVHGPGEVHVVLATL